MTGMSGRFRLGIALVTLAGLGVTLALAYGDGLAWITSQFPPGSSPYHFPGQPTSIFLVGLGCVIAMDLLIAAIRGVRAVRRDRLRWRWPTWALTLFTTAMAGWLVAEALWDAHHESCGGTSFSGLCNFAYGVGVTDRVVGIIAVWFVGFVVLSLLWIMTWLNRTGKRL